MAAWWPFDLGGRIRLGNFTRKDVALICAAALAFIAVGVGPYFWLADPASGNVAQPKPAPVRVVTAKCHTVTPRTWNKRVRLLRRISGNPRRGHLTKRKRCKHGAYADLGRAVRKARADCKRKAVKTEASEFHPGSDAGGDMSACSIWLPTYFGFGFAELGSGRAAGNLPCGTVLYINGPNGRTVAAPRIDTGCGDDSPACESEDRHLDLWRNTDEAIGVRGTDDVHYSPNNCWAV